MKRSHPIMSKDDTVIYQEDVTTFGECFKRPPVLPLPSRVLQSPTYLGGAEHKS